MIYDKNGILVNKTALKVGEEIDHITGKLMTRLFKQGMTIVEGRALIQFLQSQVTIAALLKLIRKQYP